MNNNKYLATRKAVEKLGISVQTLRNWEKQGKIEAIRTDGNQRLYNVEKFLEKHELNKNDINDEPIMITNKKYNFCYIRVSTVGQKDDLKRQKEYMQKMYPNHILIEDIGSGINFNRRGLRKIIKYAISGNIKELVVAYKDRLTRFGFELIEDLIKEYSNGEIIIVDDKDRKEPKEELVEDVLQILNVYTTKLNGLRKYSKKHDKDQ